MKGLFDKPEEQSEKLQKVLSPRFQGCSLAEPNLSESDPATSICLMCALIILHRMSPLTVSSTDDAKRKKNAKIANTTQCYPNGGIESGALKGTVTLCGLRAA